MEDQSSLALLIQVISYCSKARYCCALTCLALYEAKKDKVMSDEGEEDAGLFFATTYIDSYSLFIDLRFE